MTFNTRCPACTTVFAVPPSALSASGGWVRCGRCSEVFDATSHRDDGLNPQFDEVAERLSRQMQIPLAPEAQAQQGLRPRRNGVSPPSSISPSSAAFEPPASPAAMSSPESYAPSSSASPPEAIAPPEAAPRLALKRSSVERRRKSDTFDGSTRAERQNRVNDGLGSEFGAGPNHSESSDVPLGGARTPSTASASTPAAPSARSADTRRTRASRTRAKSDRPSAFAEQEALQSALPLEELGGHSVQPLDSSNRSFGLGYQEPPSLPAHLTAPSVATWVGSALAIALLALLLGLQVLWTQRHELATHYPSLKPALDAMCQRLQCKLMPLRQLDMVAIDNSVFRMVAPSEKGDRYQLSWVVTNQALVPVAAPALELTLHDVLDRPLLRKVITPSDLGTPDLAIAAEGKWQGAMNLNVLPPDGGVKVSGYRLIAFYP